MVLLIRKRGVELVSQDGGEESRIQRREDDIDVEGEGMKSDLPSSLFGQRSQKAQGRRQNWF